MSGRSDQYESLPSWNDNPARQHIRAFVERVTREGSADFVPPAARIAVFDNDGTLWSEKPMYVQLDHLLRKLAAQADADPTLRERQPWKAAWTKNFAWFGDAVTKHYNGDESDLRSALAGIVQLSRDQPVEAVEQDAHAFVFSQRHPTLGRRYAACAYAPMIELLRLLDRYHFTSFIVSGGGRDFMRGITEQLYGIPRERVIGSTVAYRYVETDGHGAVVQQAELDMVDDGPGKPVQIWSVIARRPIVAVGNSNGDLPMLQFAGGPALPALRLVVLHDDTEREFAYVAGAEQLLAEAKQRDWQIVSIRDDWRDVFVGDS